MAKVDMSGVFGPEVSIRVPEELWGILLDMEDGDDQAARHGAARCLAHGIEAINRLMVMHGFTERSGSYITRNRRFLERWCRWYRESFVEDDDGE